MWLRVEALMAQPCDLCPYNGGGGVLAPTERRKGALLVSIGEGPASEEIGQGGYFVGPSGRELDHWLSRAGVARAECAVGNAHECWRKEKSPAKLARAVVACRGKLAAFLEEVQPLGVLLLGGSALRSVAPGFVSGAVSDGIMRHRGSVWSREEVEAANRATGEPRILPASVRYVLATIHPAAVIGREAIEGRPAMGYRMVPPLDICRLVECVRKGRRLLPLERRMGIPPWSGREFVFDLETEGERIGWCGIQDFENGGMVWGAPWIEMRAWIKREFEAGTRCVGHNINGFDLPMLVADGLPVPRGEWMDTMTFAGVAEGDMARGLHYQAAYYFGGRRPYWKELAGADLGDRWEQRVQRGLRAAWRETEVLGEPLTELEWMAGYNALDVSSTRLVALAQLERGRKEGWC